VLVVFAGGLIAIVAVAAMVFDLGQSLLDRRAEQDAADAAALAGARYLPACPKPQTIANCPGAVSAAVTVAAKNGYTNGVGSATVTVRIPPGPESVWSGLPDHISVQIGNTRPSIFAGVLGMTQLRTGALGVAENSSGFSLPYSLLALDPTSCATNKITGSPGSSVTVGGAVHVDSNCPSSALLLSGNGVLTSPECDVVGQIQTSGGAHNNCTTSPTGVQVAGDPLRDLPAPTVTTIGNITKIGSSRAVPANCPGGTTPPTMDDPSTCTFGGVYTSTDQYRLSPGYYPGGLKFNGGTFFFEPGIYEIAGGGLSMGGTGAAFYSVDPGGTAPPSGGGILIYNTEDAVYHTECAADRAFPAGTVVGHPAVTGAVACYQSLIFNGSSATIDLQPIQTGPYTNMLIFADRNLTTRPTSADIQINGGASALTMTGTIYAPAALITINGSGATALSTQIICYDFQVNGSSGTLNITYNDADLFHLSGVGLVQ
jgi:putative Flp pilus-assembly TadE/G-like protein